MEYFKLQLGCLVVLAYIASVYIRESRFFSLNTNVKLFRVIFALGIFSVFMDGATAYTVNHLDTVHPVVNTIFHLFFLLGLDALVFLVFLYMLLLTSEFPRTKWKRAVICVPFVVNILVVIFNIFDLEYREGKITNYSMGTSAYTCFGMIAIYLVLSMGAMVKNWKYIETRKRWGIFSYMAILTCTAVCQMIYPESLISSLGVTVIIVGMYINSENPYMAELQHSRDEMVMGFATLVENKDGSTGGHIKRTTKYVRLLAEELSYRGYYSEILTKDYMRNLGMAAPMHDIGKIAIPDRVLQKPDKLTDEEFGIIKQHAEKGGKIIQETFADIAHDQYAQMAYQMAQCHHEKWNGKGYPNGLKETEIPLCARIMAIADVFDAVSEKRCYRDAMTLEESFDIIQKGRGSDFEPVLVDVFLDVKEKVTQIRQSSCM